MSQFIYSSRNFRNCPKVKELYFLSFLNGRVWQHCGDDVDTWKKRWGEEGRDEIRDEEGREEGGI